MLMSSNTSTAWRHLRERHPSTPINDPQTWHTYAKQLYEIPNQPLIPQPTDSPPTTSTFFTTTMVARVIGHLQHGGSGDHTGL